MELVGPVYYFPGKEVMSSIWAKELELARTCPPMFLGVWNTAHLEDLVRVPLWAIWEANFFEQPREALIQVSPHQIQLHTRTGPLRSEYSERFRWGEFDVLAAELLRVGGQLRREAGHGPVWERLYRYNNGHLGSVGTPMMLAERGALGIRMEAGLCCQTYEHGWPKTPPTCIEETHGTGLYVCGALSPRWFPGLPYRLEEVLAVIPDAARPSVRVEWHDEDDLVPECRRDPGCVLEIDQLQEALARDARSAPLT